MGFIDKVKKTPDTKSGCYLVFKGIDYPMKYLEGRVWLAKFLLLPLSSAVLPVSEGKIQACRLSMSHNLTSAPDSLGSLR